MQLKNQVEWALHCCAILAGVPDGGRLSAKDLAELHGVPKDYLSKALQALSQAGIAEGSLGPAGGYRLARAAEKITFLDVVEAVEGLAEACAALDIPITGGNVSLYNETDGRAIYPTPVIGVVGVIEDASRALARSFRRAHDEIVLLGEGFDELGGSEYLKTVHGVVKGTPPELNLNRERALTIVMVTHEADIAAYARREVVFRDGRIASDRVTGGRS